MGMAALQRQGKAAFLPPISAEASQSRREKGSITTERPLLAAWEVKSPLKGAKLLLCVSKGIELLRRFKAAGEAESFMDG